VDLMIAEREHITEYTEEAIRHKLGLDVPIPVQYAKWVAGIFTHGDLGTSLWTGHPVTDEIRNRWAVSFEIGIIAIAFALLIAIPVGIYSAIRQDTLRDYIARGFAVALISIPGFWLGTMVIVFPSVWWGWTPVFRYIPFMTDPIGNLKQFLVPGLILGMFLSGTTMRMARTMMLEVLRQDYIRTAWAKGLSERVVIMRHALKNALIPIVTLVGLQLPLLVGGAIVMERIFNLPGIGALVVRILDSRDYNMLAGLNIFIASFVLLINLAVDLTYGLIDPRVRYD
jgi:peptide/nickel transport system permease protein